jgi:predicted site-specific integrase-resolvase
MVRNPKPQSSSNVGLSARVSSVDQKQDLDRKMYRLKDYAAAQGHRATR